MSKKPKIPNLLLLGIDSLRADHMSLYGYKRLTTPHIDKFAARGAVFSNLYSPSIPTTPGYTSMFTGLDVFSTDVVALRHKGGLNPEVKTLSEVLGQAGYNTSCVGFSSNPASRGFQKYIDFEGWGSWDKGRSPKAANLNAVAIPELKRLAGEDQPFFLFLRHMDPHSPYLPPGPFERMFYEKNEHDSANHSLDPVMKFKPFCDYYASWFPPGCTDKDYIIAQYDGAVAYMDSCIANIFATLTDLGIEEETLVVIDSDHGETLYDHDCYFDHHGLYDCALHVPLVFVFPGKVPAGQRFSDHCQTKDVMPSILELLGVNVDHHMDGRSLAPLLKGRERAQDPELYLTECTWMRKHGWRTPQHKLIHALEPDFHFKPEFELYDLIRDPEENHNIADAEPEVLKLLLARMEAHVAKREKETGRRAPIHTNLNWHNLDCGPFKTSQQAYDSMHIGSPNAAKDLQSKVLKELQTQRGSNTL
jgi:arylsulfatase A-like enzyme